MLAKLQMTLSTSEEIYDTAVAQLTAYFEPTSNTDMAIFQFRDMKQEPGETLNVFYRLLKKKQHVVNSMTKIVKSKP